MSGDASTTDKPDVTPVDTGAPDAGAEESLLTGEQNPESGDDNADANADVDSNTDTGDSDGNASDADADDGNGADADSDGEGDVEVEYANFELPDGMELDQQLLDTVAPVFKEAGLTKDQAQKLVTAYSDQIQAMYTANQEAFQNVVNGWKDQSKTDKDFGGDNFNESIATARFALDKIGTPELLTALNETGMGSHPEVIRFMVKVGSMLKEDVPGKPGTQPSKEKSRLQTLYPNAKN